MKKEDSVPSWINRIIPLLGLKDFNGTIDVEFTVENCKVTKINNKDKKPLK